MHFDWWTLGLQTVNLLVLLWLLGRFLFRPMARIVAERQAEAARLTAEAEAERAKAEEAARAAEAERDSVLAEREEKLKAARAEAETARTALVEAAREEARRIEDEGNAAAARIRAKDQRRAGKEANALAADIAARLLAGPAAHLPLQGFLDGFEQALASLPQDIRASIGTDGTPVTVRVAQGASPEDRAALDAAFERALGRKLAFTTVADASLIAGLSLETGMVSVANSLSGDLARVRAGLDGPDA